MIIIKANTASDAWRQAFKKLFTECEPTSDDKYLRDEAAVIEISNPSSMNGDMLFPMPQAEIDRINRFIVSGEQEDLVTHEWTKLYYHRAFDEPNSQMKYLLSVLDETQPVGETQISIWDKNVDQNQSIAPCAQIVWARIKHGKLEVHTHSNSSDAYKKLLMNMLEFIAVQEYIAEQAGYPVGTYIHFIDSCHLHKKDQQAIQELATRMETA